MHACTSNVIIANKQTYSCLVKPLYCQLQGLPKVSSLYLGDFNLSWGPKSRAEVVSLATPEFIGTIKGMVA